MAAPSRPAAAETGGMRPRARWLNPGMSQGAWVLVVALVLATAFGLLRAARDGRFRGTHPVKGAPATDAHEVSVLHDSDIEHELGERATLLQFSSAFCAPCRATRRVLADVAQTVPGVVHVEVDAEHHLELVRTPRHPADPDHAGARRPRPGGLPGRRRPEEGRGPRHVGPDSRPLTLLHRLPCPVTEGGLVNLLFVCTANICRSAYAQLMTEHLLAGRAGVQVSSAGTHGFRDHPMDPPMAAQLAGPRGRRRGSSAAAR